MQTPEALLSLVDEGVIESVVRPLMSGKEAQVYLVRSDGELRVAKVYKEAQHRSFKQRAEYTEGRNIRNSRDQRAMAKRTRHGRAQEEAAWRTAEVDMIYRLQAAGVRVPKPYHFLDGVLIMEMVCDADGHPAPRLGDLSFDAEGATEVFERVLAEVVRMLAAGVVHGDLSDFNVLMGTDGPVIIDFPQAVNTSSNQNARKLLVRDVENLHRFISKYVPGRQPPPFAQEMWQLYERGELTPDTKLRGRYSAPRNAVNVDGVSSLIADAARDEQKRREALGQRLRAPAPVEEQAKQSPRLDRPARPYVQDMRPPQQPSRQRGYARAPDHGRGPVYPQNAQARGPLPQNAQASDPAAAKRKRRRRRRKAGGGTAPTPAPAPRK